MDKKTAIGLGSDLLVSNPIINATASAIGSAKTGTAIGSLHGAAHASATAAWLGFGSMKIGMFIMGALPVIGALMLLNGVSQKKHGTPLIDWYEEYWKDYEVQHELTELQPQAQSDRSHQYIFKETPASFAQLEERFRTLEVENELAGLKNSPPGVYLGTWGYPVLSICEYGDAYLWALWTSKIDADEFLERTEKDLILHCYRYGESSSQAAALSEARKFLPEFRQLDSKWAMEVGKIIEAKSGCKPQSNTRTQSEVNLETSTPPIESPPTELETALTDPLLEQLQKLHALIGLDGVKSTVQELVNIAKVSRMKAQVGLKAPTITRHLVLTGNPGTGKTTVARLLGQIYSQLGVLSKGHFVEVDRTQLVAGHIGQTAPKTKQVVESALGGVLFIDEAYSLVPESHKDPFGDEAINTLLRLMVDHADNLVVIVAGYKNEMTRFIESNPGLKSRFSRSIHFADYSPAELVQIFTSRCEQDGYVLSDGTIEAVQRLVTEFEPRIGQLGNGRFIKNVFDRCIAIQCSRLAALTNPSKEDLITFLASDIPSGQQLEEYLV